MPQHTTVALIDGEWTVTGRRGNVLATYPNEHAARRAIADDKTPTERAAAFGDATLATTKTAAYEAALLARLDAGLPLSRADAKTARSLRPKQKS
jgi:hypothetical protein